MRIIYISILSLLMSVVQGFGKTVVFFEKGFPSIDNSAISRTVLERALALLDPRFVGIGGLKDDLAEGDLLVLPYGSAFPADAWEEIHNHLESGNFLVLGGRPLYMPVYRDSAGWRTGFPQNSFSGTIGIVYSYSAPQHGPWSLKWDEDAPFFHATSLDPRRVFVNAVYGGRYRGLGFLVNKEGDRLAAPVVATDMVDHGPPRRGVFLSFDADSTFWNSEAGIELIREGAIYASYGGVRLWLNLQKLSLDPGDRVTGAVDLLRCDAPAKLTIQLLSGSKILETKRVDCGSTLHEEIDLTHRLNKPGLYTIRAMLSIGDTVFDQYTSGVEVCNPALLASGKRLEAGRDYFKLGAKPYLMVGVNYFSTDPYTSDFFVGGSLGGNAYVWERDFAEMEGKGLNVVRTGIWLNRLRYLDQVSGAADERLLGAIEAYLAAAARHHMQVIFTFFAFNPQVEMQSGPGQEGDRLGPGSNPYLDPVAVDAQIAYVRSIVERFKSVPFLSYDLINEPSYSNPDRIWKGNSPNGDPNELSAWQHWLENHYGTIDNLAETWRVSPAELGSFDNVSLPEFADLELTRYGNPRVVRAVDYNLFAQDAFIQWVDKIVEAIRSTGSKQAITVGQDEGGVVDRVLTQFWARSNVTYTVNHTWWRDDALLWNSVVAKTAYKPNLIEETGPQPVWSMDGKRRLDDMDGLGLEERKLALAFANGGAGVLHWDWTRSGDFGLLRPDGSQKVWMDVIEGIASFARAAEPHAAEAKPPEIAIVLPQSLQLSTFNRYGIEVQQKAVRALYQYARGTAFAVGEYQLSHAPGAKLIIVPAPWVFSQEAWDELMARVKGGATLLVSGRIDANEHWHSIPERTRDWNVGYSEEPLRTRYAKVAWPGDSARLSYSEDKTTYADRGVLGGGSTFAEIPTGKGRILYFALPLEMADQLDAIGRAYKYAIERAGVSKQYTTTCDDPGMLIAPARLPDATLYVLTSESTSVGPLEFCDGLSGGEFKVHVAPGRAALLLVGKNGRIISSYNVK